MKGTGKMYRIFIIEDDFSLAQTMKQQIESWGNAVKVSSDFQNVISEFEEYNPHMVLVDIMLPFFNGYYWCNEIRKQSNVPVIFISSASDNMNVIMAMNMRAVQAGDRSSGICGGAVHHFFHCLVWDSFFELL